MCKPKQCSNRAVLVVAAAVATAVIWVKVRHPLAHYLSEVAYWAAVAGLVLAVAAAVYGVARLFQTRVPSRPPGGNLEHPNGTSALAWLRHVPLAVWVLVTWRSMCRRLGLVSRDRQVRSATEHRPKAAHHPLALVYPTRAGVTVRARTVASVSRLEVERQLDHFANHWRVQRVALSQPRPGSLVLRGLRRDPLTAPLALADAPAGTYSGAGDLRRLYLGRSEAGLNQWVTVEGNTALTIAGVPGSGKSETANGLLLQIAPSPAAQFATADGKSPRDGGDYEVWRPRAWRTCSDDRQQVAGMLAEAVEVMRERLAVVEQMTGGRNAWHAGPSPEFPLLVIVLSECQRYLDASDAELGKGKNRDTEAEKHVLTCQRHATQLVRQGRSVLVFLVLDTQRPNADSLPTSLRDNAALNLSLALKTRAACKMAMGDDITEFESFLPTTLQGEQFIGCGVANIRNGADPYLKLRFPHSTKRDLEEAARSSAHLRRDPMALVAAAGSVPDDASELVTP